MACYSRWSGQAPSGAFVRNVACGQCIGCRLEYSRNWAIRCVHESKLYDSNCFVLLTYRDLHFSLVYRDFQLFMKRLRKHFGVGVRFFMSGEYGTLYSRPHFHAALFNCAFSDMVYYKNSPAGFKLYRSKVLEGLWPHGFSSVGTLTFESAAYIARYVTKKVLGDGTEIHEIIDPDTGEVFRRVKEFARMSLRPGIGAEWFRRFRSDVSHDGNVIVRGREARMPRYYDKLLRASDAGQFMKVQFARRLRNEKFFGDDAPQRLEAKETVTRARLSLFKRGSIVEDL